MAEEFRTPQSANEAALQNWAGADNELRAPQSRIEKLLLAILGEDVTPDPPQSVNEELLTQIYEQGGGGTESPFELYKTSSKYMAAESITSDEKDELLIAKGNIVIAYAESEGIIISAIRTTVSTNKTWTFQSYGLSSVSDGNYIRITFAGTSGTSARKITTIFASKDGVALQGSVTIWFEYYKLK